LFPLVEEVLNRFTKYINDEVKKDEKHAFDAREICAKFTTDVVSSCIFNADAQSFATEKPEIREMGRKIMDITPFLTFIFIVNSIFPSFTKLYKAKFVAKEVEDFFTNLMHQAVEHREKNPVNRDDYLAFLISMKSKKQFSELDMAAHGVTFFIGEIFI
jgi:cytochrome P450